MPITFKPSPNNEFAVYKPSNYETYKKSENFIAGSPKPERYRPVSNGFFKSVYTAYNHHYGLVLKPDDVLLSIMASFSTHVEKNAELLRSKFVEHSGKKKLTVFAMANLQTAPYDLLCKELANQIALNIKDPSLREWVIPNFSTTTDNDRVIGSMFLMSTMKAYFGYKMMLCCGLPEVTLLGTVDDWVSLRKRVDRLLEFDNEEGHMKIWHRLLTPILDNFVESAKGSPNLEWWNRCCSHLTGGSGPQYISGWLSVFTPFDNNGYWNVEKLVNGELPVYEIEDEYRGAIRSEWPIIEIGDVADEIKSVEIEIDDNGVHYDTILYAGASGIQYLDDTHLSPCYEWSLEKVVN